MHQASQVGLQLTVEQHGLQTAVVFKHRLHQPPAQGKAHGLHQRNQILIYRGILEQYLEDSTQVTNGHLLAQQLLKHLLHFSKGEQLRYEFLDEFWMRFIQRIEQPLGFAAGQQFVRVAADQL